MMYQAEMEIWYPHIVTKLYNTWGTVEFYPYIESLFLTDRTNRRGFGDEEIKELLFLLVIHSSIFPDERIKDPWSRALDRT